MEGIRYGVSEGCLVWRQLRLSGVTSVDVIWCGVSGGYLVWRQLRLSGLASVEVIWCGASGAKSAVGGRIWSNLELIRVLIHVIITCKYENDRVKKAEKSGIIDF